MPRALPLSLAALALVVGCTGPGDDVSTAAADTAATADAVPPVRVEPLADGVWMHTSYERIGGAAVPSHGLIVRTGDTVLLVDTGWNDDQTAEILDWADAHDLTVTEAVLTHAHSDKMGGVPALKARGVRTFAHNLANEDAPARGLEPAETGLFLNPGDSSMVWSGVEVMYPGAGHTRGNLVLGIRGQGIVFGGCLIRPGDATDLGNTADADVPEWAASAERVGWRFEDAGTIVPSHGDPGGRDLIAHTVALAKKAAATR